METSIVYSRVRCSKSQIEMPSLTIIMCLWVPKSRILEVKSPGKFYYYIHIDIFWAYSLTFMVWSFSEASYIFNLDKSAK